MKNSITTRAYLVMLGLISGISLAASAQTLSSTVTTSTYPDPCSQYNIQTATIYTYTWQVTDKNGGIHKFAGSTNRETVPCRTPPPPTSLSEWSTDNLYHITATGQSGSLDGTGSQGYVYPKYVIVGLTYAPPGGSSSVSYGNTVSVGNTTSITSSFQSDTDVSVSVSGSLGIPKAGIVGGGVSLTFTSDTDYLQGSSTTNSTTITKSTAITYKTSGYPVPIVAPIVASDYDIVWLWLNPVMVFTSDPAVASSPASLIYQGYAFDPNDPAGTNGPDVYPVQLGYLNGHFQDSPSVDAVLSRSWTGPDNLIWPSGEGPGLTAADKASIVGIDPLASSQYTGFNDFPVYTPDGRFTQGPYPPNPIPFVPGVTTTYNTTQESTTMQQQQATSTFKQAFGSSQTFGTNFFDIFSSTTTIKETQTFTWTHITLSSLTTSDTLMQNLTVVGPPNSPPYAGPGQFIYYQDNLFGSFAFPPS